MKATVYDIDYNYLFECKARYKKSSKVVSLLASADLSTFDSTLIFNLTDDAMGVYELVCKYKGTESEDAYVVANFEVVQELSYVQRRQDLKVKTNVPVICVLLDYDNKVKIDPETKKAIQTRAILRDISAGGIMIASRTQFEVGQRIMIPFDKGSSPILVNAQIIRVNQSEDGIFAYGCSFFNMTSSKEAVIREYVFRLQAAIKTKTGSGFD